MKAIPVLLLLATQASAATISLTADQPSYVVGDTITLTVIGDAEGSTAYGIYGRLVYDGALVDTVSALQTPVDGWIDGPLNTGDGYAEVWNQIAGLDAATAPAPVVSTVVLQAQAAGTLEIDWSTATGFELAFFGAIGPPLSVEIACVVDCTPPDPPSDPPAVPEPSAALVFAIGLALVAMRGKR